MRHQFTAAHRNWSQQEDKDVAAKLPDVILEPEDHRIDPLSSLEPGWAAPPSRATTATFQAVCYPRWEPPQPPPRFELNIVENHALTAKLAEAPWCAATHRVCRRRR
jgi:hypothetical protein